MLRSMLFSIVALSLSFINFAVASSRQYNSCAIYDVSDLDENGKNKIAVWGVPVETADYKRQLITGTKFQDTEEGRLAAYNSLRFLKQQNICRNNDGEGLLSE